MLKKKISWFNETMAKLKDIPLLLLRLVLAYGFYTPAMKKLGNIDGIIKWFEKMEIPAPALNAYLATFTEVLGVILLVLGLGTRYIAIPLIITMLVAIFTVHLDNGFLAAKNGFQIPFYFIIMLITLLINGSGKISLDYLIGKKIK
jgi:putative oxidoreductase